MRSVLYLALSALAAVAVADKPNPFNIPNQGYTFTVGEPTTLSWSPNTEGTVTLKLLTGAVTNPKDGTTIASSIPNSGSYQWTPPSDIAAEPDYTIEIINDSDPSQYNFLPRFVIAGATGTQSVASATGTSTTSAATTASPTTLTTKASTTSPTSAASTTSGTTSPASSTTSGASTTTGSASTSAAASTTSGAAASTSAAPSSTTSAPNMNGAGVTRVSVGMMAVVAGAIAFI